MSGLIKACVCTLIAEVQGNLLLQNLASSITLKGQFRKSGLDHASVWCSTYKMKTEKRRCIFYFLFSITSRTSISATEMFLLPVISESAAHSGFQCPVYFSSSQYIMYMASSVTIHIWLGSVTCVGGSCQMLAM